MHKSLRRGTVLAGLVFFLMSGIALAASCSTCGYSLVPKARFCYQCGTRVPTKPAQKTKPYRANEKPSDVPFRYAPTPPTATGKLKIGSAPIRCQVKVLGRTLEKKRAIQTITHVPVGKHQVEFMRDGKVVTKEIVIIAGKSTIVFGNLLGNRTTTNAPDDRYLRKSTRTPSRGVSTQPITRQIPNADGLYDQAELLRRAFNPFKKAARYREAEGLYVKLLKDYPNSDKVELSLYQLGNIYESVYYRNYLAAIDKYKQVLDRNFATALDVRWRIGVLYDNRQFEHTRGKNWFQMAAKHSKNMSTQKRAAARAKELEARGF